ncbi:TIGR00269 family protein [Methanoregula sp.]|jgi:uncharacterized protein (TIGR00269 family)|uniref:TIGR00269 family protein n=1 Tax=Methanoregula sp. TaxID=2052170 RepID=UPI003C1549B2
MGNGSAMEGQPRCSLCSEPAVFFDRLAHCHLCRVHFFDRIEQRVADTIAARNLIVPGDTVAVGLSGGKDSTALMMIISKLLPSWENIRLVAVTVDEGIRGYREETIQSADRFARTLGVEHRHVTFPDIFGDSLDGIISGRESQACSICGILRKKALASAAREAGATKLATGHNLDDEAQSVLMNVLRGDLPRLVRDSSTDSSGRFIPRIKPLMAVSEKEIAAYLLLRNAWNDLPECPYARHALRREVRSMLSSLEYRHPGTMLRLMESKGKIEKSCTGVIATDPLRSCRECGDPCSRELCQLCQLKRELGRELAGNRF